MSLAIDSGLPHILALFEIRAVNHLELSTGCHSLTAEPLKQMKVRTTFEICANHTGTIVAKEVRDAITNRSYEHLSLQIV